MNFGEQIWCVLSEEMFENLPPYGPMLMKMEKKSQKSKI